MFLGGNFEDGGDGFVVVLEHVSDVVGNVLIDENDTDIFPRGELLEGGFDELLFSVLVDNEKVRAFGRAMSDSGQQEASDGILMK